MWPKVSWIFEFHLADSRPPKARFFPFAGYCQQNKRVNYNTSLSSKHHYTKQTILIKAQKNRQISIPINSDIL